MTLRVLIADDHTLVRDLFMAYLTGLGDFTVTAAADVDAAAAALATGPFDLILLDYHMPGMNGFAGLARMIEAAAPTPVAIISGTAIPAIAEQALQQGAAGFLPKSLPARSLINAIRFMIAGEIFLPSEMNRAGGGAVDPFDGQLSTRERQVLAGLCQGKSNKQIALDLGLQEPTVKLHVKLVCRKLSARNRTHAAMIARDAGMG
jgi:two-component system nitrate/nitrite response regulator NarL